MRLPIDEVREDIVASFADGVPRRMLVRAPTGSGKSTGLPSMLLDGADSEGMIVVVQPRRLAARMLAKRVAELRCCALGGEVGYVVRFDRKMCASTRIVFVTDGVLERWLVENPLLDGISAVVFDEFHERRLAMDVALADCLNLQEKQRNDLLVCVMSATIDVQGLEAFLEPARLIEAGGRMFPVEVSYQKKVNNARGALRDEEIWDRCARAVREVIADGQRGAVLVFLPGVYEIKRTAELLKGGGFVGWEVCELYGGLSPEMQDKAVRDTGPEAKRIIVSTNVAETSLTIPGVTLVVDSGLARVAEFDPLRGFDTLFVRRISRAAAKQRAGRAGRVAAGKVVKLWSEAEEARMVEHDLAEVRRMDVTEVVLRLLVRGYAEVSDFRWLESPSDEGVKHALELLEVLGAVKNNKVTVIGKTLATMPVHPRLGRLLLAGRDEKCLSECVFAVALLQGEGVFVKGKYSGRAQFVVEDDGVDFWADWRGFESARAMKFDPRRCSNLGVSGRGARELEKGMQQLNKTVSRLGWKADGNVDFGKRKPQFSRAVLAAYGDRVAVRLGAGNLTCRVVGGQSGQLGADSGVKSTTADEVIVATEMTEVGGKGVVKYLNGCVVLTIEDLKVVKSDLLVDSDGAIYDEKIRRVVQQHEQRYRDLVIWNKVGGDPDRELAAELLAERVASGELKLNKWDRTVEQWIARLLCLREWMPELELPDFSEEDRALALVSVCDGALGYKEIKNREVQPALNDWLSAGQHAALNAYAPERLTLKNGAKAKLNYEVGKAPSMALKVQRLYGVKSTPTIANGTVKVILHICGPNQRPWQMTDDLEGFWSSGFEQMRKDLKGRYPRHDWEGNG